MRKALDGVRVVDMTHVQAGPVCTQLLAWMGADVIKIEQPGGGDVTRSQLRDLPDVDSLYFTMLNGNKRSLTLNMKSDEGREVFTKLLERSDVVVENFGPGVMDRLGYTWERLMHKIGRPDLIENPDYATPEARLPHLQDIFDVIEEWTIQRTKWEAFEELNSIDVPCGPVLSTKDLIEDEGLRAEGLIVDVDHPERGTYSTVGCPFTLSD